MLDLSDLGDWRPPIVAAVATDDTGVGDIWSAVEAHRASIEKGGQLQQRRDERLRQELRHIVVQRLEARARDLCQGSTYDELERTVLERGMDPWAATDVLLDGVGA
jgi:LAO/AO transport system kinase